MKKITYHKTKYKVNPAEILRKSVICNLNLFAKSKDDIVDFFKENKFCTNLEDYRGITDYFLIVQILNDKELLVSKVSFSRSKEKIDKDVIFNTEIESSVIDIENNPYLGLLTNYKKDKDLASNFNSAFFIENLAAYQGVKKTVLDQQKTYIVEHLYLLTIFHANNIYEV